MYSVLIYNGSFKETLCIQKNEIKRNYSVFDSKRLAIFEEIIAETFPKPIINTSHRFKKYFEPQGEKYKKNPHTLVPHNETDKN